MTGTDPDSGFVEALRHAADVVEGVNGIADVYWATTIGGVYGVLFEVGDVRPVMARVARAMKFWSRAGTVGKRYDDGALKLDVDCGARVQVTVSASMVCEAVVVGTETRTVPKVTQPAVVEHVDEEVDVIEWRCGDPILDTEVGR